MVERFQSDNACTLLLSSGFTTIPGALMRLYKQIGLSDEEMMLFLHLIQFQQEGVALPSSAQLAARMTLHQEMLQSMIMRLLQSGFLSVEANGLEERFDLKPLYRKLSACLEPPKPVPPSSLDLLEKKETNLFSMFEQEFGRPLSPLEYERIARWIDEDHYREELIREALQEAVMAGKFNFKYIDRILFEWQKHNIRSMHELNTYREQFRNRLPNGRGPARQAPAAQGKGPAPAEGEQANKYDAFYQMYGGGQRK